MGFGVEDKMIFEAEKKRRKRAGEMGSSYVLKSVVELELFSNLWYFKSYFFQLLYIYQESHTHPSLHFNPEPILLKYPNCPKKTRTSLNAETDLSNRPRPAPIGTGMGSH